MSKKYQYLAGLQKSTGEIIYSRSRHDFRQTSDTKGFIDGGTSYCRHSGLELIVVEFSVDPATLFNDWNNRVDKYGIARTYTKSGMLIESPGFIRIVPEGEYEDKTTFEYKKKYFTWGTYGPKGDQPRKTVMLTECETSHLTAILTTQTHISPETRKIIQSILSDRGVK